MYYPIAIVITTEKTPDLLNGEAAQKGKFAVDSLLEERGLEQPVPPREIQPITGTPHRSSVILAARSGVGVSGTDDDLAIQVDV
jgi:hypothetical protein